MNQNDVSPNTLELAAETLSWIELENMGTAYAFSRALQQLDIKNKGEIDHAHKLIEETLRRLNAIDLIISTVIPEEVLSNAQIGINSFLRILVYLAQYSPNTRLTDLYDFVANARKCFGWRNVQPVEAFVGRLILTGVKDVSPNISKASRIALETFHPEWFVEYCIGILGEKETDLLLTKNNDLPPVQIRLNGLQMRCDDILHELRRERITVLPEEGTKTCFRVFSAPHHLTSTRSYRQGLFHIQDKASAVAVEVANPKPGELVLDLCSAPGSKSSFISEMMKNTGDVISVEKSPKRATVQKNEMKRLGVRNIHLIVADTTRPLPFRKEADLVVLDPPCSNTGLFRRDPLSRWRVTFKDIDLFAKEQQKMIQNAASHVKKHGRLTYATCSITAEENEHIIMDFLSKRKNFAGVELNGFSKPLVSELKCCLRLYGHQHDSNGFFIALLKRSQ